MKLVLSVFSVLSLSFLYSQAIIIDHTCTDHTQIPASVIDDIQSNIKWHYAHTSHGEQLTWGLQFLENDDPSLAYEVGSSYLPDLSDELCIFDGQESATYITPDLYWQTPYGLGLTQDVIDNNPSINLSQWAFCTQLNYYTEAQVQDYLDAMAGLEIANPDVRFIYMTGNAQADGAEGYNRYLRNEQIRQYCIDNEKILFDFADLDCWHDGVMNSYSYSGNTIPLQHTAYDADIYGHTNELSCRQKGSAVWWMLAVLSGWNGPSGYSVSPEEIDFDDVFIGNSGTEIFSITNLDTIPITIDSIICDTPEFDLSYNSSDLAGVSLAVGEIRNVEVTFSPLAEQSYAGIITLYSAQTENDTVEVFGNGIEEPEPPSYSVEPSTISFGSVLIGNTQNETITISNIVAEPVTIDSLITDDSVFTLTDLGIDLAGFTLAAGESRDIQVSFAPVAEILYTANLTIYSNSTENSIIPLNGVGSSGGAYHVSGDVSGIWNYSTIYVDGNISISDGNTLQIIPTSGGTNVIFSGYYQFSISGQLLAEGSESDKINFLAADPDTGWKGMRFYNLSWNTTDSSSVVFCNIQDGIASGSGYDGYGGGIFATYSSRLKVQNCIIENNTAVNGGGLYLEGSQPILKNLIIRNNSASGNGGGIYSHYSSPQLNHLEITNNSAVNGSGVYFFGEDSGNPSLINCTLSENTATTQGGAIFIEDWANPVLNNCILWNNTPDEINIGNGTITATYSNIMGGLTGNGNIDDNPLFVDATTGDFQLTSSSPCIDSGDPGSPIDPDGTRCDMGAYFFSILESPENVDILIDEINIHLTWDEVTGAISYKVYSSDHPDAVFTEDTSGSFDGSSWIAPIPNSKKFYYIKAIRNE